MVLFIFWAVMFDICFKKYYNNLALEKEALL